MAADLTDHLEFNFSEEIVCGPVLFGGPAKDGICAICYCDNDGSHRIAQNVAASWTNARNERTGRITLDHPGLVRWYKCFLSQCCLSSGTTPERGRCGSYSSTLLRRGAEAKGVCLSRNHLCGAVSHRYANVVFECDF